MIDLFISWQGEERRSCAVGAKVLGFRYIEALLQNRITERIIRLFNIQHVLHLEFVNHKSIILRRRRLFFLDSVILSGLLLPHFFISLLFRLEHNVYRHTLLL